MAPGWIGIRMGRTHRRGTVNAVACAERYLRPLNAVLSLASPLVWHCRRCLALVLLSALGLGVSLEENVSRSSAHIAVGHVRLRF